MEDPLALDQVIEPATLTSLASVEGCRNGRLKEEFFLDAGRQKFPQP
jgi:hypothetical protein